jgi:hypothetical protein
MTKTGHKREKDEKRLKEKVENQYRAKVRKVFDKYTDENGLTTIRTDIEVPQPADGDWWGTWRYDAKRLVLEYYNKSGYSVYEVDLEQCSSSSQVLDWICQLNEKRWCGYLGVGQFIKALNDLIDLRHIAHLGDKSFDAGMYLRKQSGKN